MSDNSAQIAEWNGQEEAGSSAPPAPRRFGGGKPGGKKPYLGKKPPRYLKAGDVVELGIQGLGVQRQQVRADA